MKKLIFEKIYRDERLVLESYYKDETSLDLHREDGPAKIRYYYNGNIRDEEYYKDGVLISVGIIRNQGCV